MWAYIRSLHQGHPVPKSRQLQGTPAIGRNALAPGLGSPDDQLMHLALLLTLFRLIPPSTRHASDLCHIAGMDQDATTG